MATMLRAHAVTAARIISVQPLVTQGRLVSPDAGLLLVLADGSREKWISEKDNVTPAPGDWLVTDGELHAAYVVSAQKFATLFEVTK